MLQKMFWPEAITKIKKGLKWYCQQLKFWWKGKSLTYDFFWCTVTIVREPDGSFVYIVKYLPGVLNKKTKVLEIFYTKFFYKNECKLMPSEDMNKGAAHGSQYPYNTFKQLFLSYLTALLYINFYKLFFSV